MAQTVLFRNTIDAWTSPSRPPARFGDTRLSVHSEAHAFVYFTRPKLPEGAVVISAKFRVYPGEAAAASPVTLELHRLTAPFDPNTLTWSGQPAVGSLVDTVSRPTWWENGALIEFDVTAHVQAIVDGEAWFGWRISSDEADSTQYLYSGQSTKPLELVVEYSAPPLAPVDLRPNTNEQVGDPKPTLSWTTPGGVSASQLAIQIQVATTADFSSGVYTTSEITTGASSFDLDEANPVFTAIPTGQSRWWRVRIKNDYGSWSSWSSPAQFKYVFPHTVNVTSPVTTSTDPTPTVNWTYSGNAKAWQMLVFRHSDWKLLHDSGMQYNVVNSTVIPEGVISHANQHYRVVIRVWDADYVSIPGSSSYREDWSDWEWDPAGATPAVELTVGDYWMPKRPGLLVRWRYTGAAPKTFGISRWRDGVFEKWWMVDPAANREWYNGVATDWYHTLDYPPGRADITYRVMTHMADGTSSGWDDSPIETVRADYEMPWVMSLVDHNRHFFLVNASIDPGLSEISDVVVPVGGAPFLAQYALQKFNGHAEGTIADGVLPDISTEALRDNFLWIRENPRVRFFFQDQVVECFIYNSAFTPVGRADGGTDYAVSFDFVEV